LKNRTKGIIAGGIVLIVALVFILWPTDNTQETPEVQTAPVTEQDFQEVVSTVGIIEPVQNENLLGQGLVTEVNVEENEEVAEDDVLVTYADGTQLLAPFSGTVTQLNVEADEVDANAQQNQPSITVANLDDLEVAIELSKNEANAIAVDQNVELTYLEETYEGIVSSIDSIATASDSGSSPLQAGQATPTLNATVTFETEDTNALIPGFDIDADIVTNTSTGALAIPIEALLYNDEGNPYVYVVENGVANAREVETGIQEGVSLEILDGLAVDDQVIQLPDDTLTDGTEVTVVNDDANE
jgi:HlyD family secretion protein